MYDYYTKLIGLDKMIMEQDQSLLITKANITTESFRIYLVMLSFFLLLIASSDIAASESSSNIEPNLHDVGQEIIEIKTSIQEQRKTIKSITESLAENSYESLTNQLKSLEKSITKIEAKLNTLNSSALENKVNTFESTLESYSTKDDYFSYADWAAIAVTCVAVLLTIMGVAIAVIAFWGFTQIKDFTKNSAATEAKAVTETTVNEILNNVVKSELEKLINNGKLQKPLQDAVDMILRSEIGKSELYRTKAIFDELDIDEEEILRSDNNNEG